MKGGCSSKAGDLPSQATSTTTIPIKPPEAGTYTVGASTKWARQSSITGDLTIGVLAPTDETGGSGLPIDPNSLTPAAPETVTLERITRGLPGRNRCVRDLVIRITIGQPVRVYAEEFVPVGKLAALVGEVPKLEPMVLFTDRLEVEPGDGGRIVVRQLARSDEDERNCCLQLLERLESADDAERQRIKDFLYGKPE